MKGASLAHRLLCVPLQGRRLAFHLRSIPLHRKVTSTDFADWRCQQGWMRKVGHATNWGVYRSIEAAEQQWKQLEEAPLEAWRGRLYALIDRFLLTYIYPPETLCKAVDVPDSSSPDVGYQILHPSDYDAQEVLQQLSATLVKANSYHSKLSIWSGACLVLTGALFAIPGPPNVPFYWNAYRSYSHYRAAKGSHYLLLQLHKEFPEHVTVPEKLLSGPLARARDARVQLTVCSELDDLPQLRGDSVIRPETIDELGDEFSDVSLSAHLKNAVRVLNTKPARL